MLDPTRQEQMMKRTAVVFGMAAALFVVAPAAKAGNATPQVRSQVVAQVVTQRVAAQVVTQRVVAQVVTQRVDAAVVAQRVGVQRLRLFRTPSISSLLR
jgi:hypothetical protein